MNKNHPELKDGEMFLTNISKNLGYINADYYNLIGYKTKRKGIIAFTKYGEIINDMYPVFIKISEFNAVQNDNKHHSN